MTEQMSHRVLIAGGGPAALEAAFTLQRVAGDRVATTILAPETHFVARPMTVLSPFAAGGPERRLLSGLAEEAGATVHRGALASVEPGEHRVVTTEGELIEYDSLLLAVGGVPRQAFPHSLTFGGPGSEERMHGLVQDLEEGFVRSIAFVVPSTASWPLPLYELALMSADRAYDQGISAKLTIVTPEASPLAIFGESASGTVRRLLARAGIEVIAGAHAEVPERGTVRTVPGSTMLHVDRIVTLPEIDGPAIEGLPHNRAGFLNVDRFGQVAGVDDVYAAGDATEFPIKQGGIACQQADAAAEAIAAVAGAPIQPEPFSPVLRGVLVTEYETRFMERDASGADGDRSSVGVRPLWWPPTKISGRELSRHVGDIHTRPVPEGRAVEVDMPVSIG